MTNGFSNSGKALLSPPDFRAQDLVLGHEIVSLPLFARLYLGAFKSGAGQNTPRWKLLACRAAYYVLDAMACAPSWGSMSVDIRGHVRRIQFNCRNRQFNSLYFEKYAAGYEPSVTATLLALLPRDGILYDIGSNWGYFSLLVARRKEFLGHVHAFEPWPASFTDLTSVIRQADLNHIITPHPVALAADSGEASMTSGRHSGLARVVSVGAGAKVSKRCLDDLQLEPPSLIKLDVEGFEAAALRGGQSTICSSQPFLILESSAQDQVGSTEAVMRLLEEWDYRLFIPALANATSRRSSTLMHDTAPISSDPFRLVMHPITSRSRRLHRDYLNILAAPTRRCAQLEPLVENA